MMSVAVAAPQEKWNFIFQFLALHSDGKARTTRALSSEPPPTNSLAPPPEQGADPMCSALMGFGAATENWTFRNQLESDEPPRPPPGPPVHRCPLASCHRLLGATGPGPGQMVPSPGRRSSPEQLGSTLLSFLYPIPTKP
ncbi:unnamed protein product [Arctogadus glacialis]